MKKRLVCFLTALCMVLPCFFAVACSKNQNDDNKNSKNVSYTYSVTLNNFEGKINENSLKSILDNKNSEVDWIKSDSSWTISVTKNKGSKIENKISLLEGIDYTNLDFSNNGSKKDFSVEGSESGNCANKAYLTERNINLGVDEISSDTSYVLDFENCEVAKIAIDVSNLKTNSVTFAGVPSEALTLSDAEENLQYSEFQNNTITLDYGSIVAFKSSERINFSANGSINSTSLDYASFGSNYLISNDDGGKTRIQYLTFKMSGTCSMGDKNGQEKGVKIISSKGMRFYSSYTNLVDNNSLDLPSGEEKYDGENIEFKAFTGNNLYITLDSSAKEYYYYLIDELGGIYTNEITSKICEENGKTYLELNITDGYKYLVRKAKNNSDVYYVYADGVEENFTLVDADFVLIGSSNKPTGCEIDDIIFYGYNTSCKVKVGVDFDYNDISSMFSDKISSASLSFSSVNKAGNWIDDIHEETWQASKQKEFVIYDGTNKYYSCSSSLQKTFLESEEINLDLTEIANCLYDGESVYYSMNINEIASWKVLNENEEISFYTTNGTIVYYYIDSDRDDAFLQLETQNGSLVGFDKPLRDCFGRTFEGSININGKEVSFEKIRYFVIEPGFESYESVRLIRDYDRNLHEMQIGVELGTIEIMISFNGFNAESFASLEDYDKLNISYNGKDSSPSIYYYIVGNLASTLVIRDVDDEIIGGSEPVYQNGELVKIDGRVVYGIKLYGGYFSENDSFKLGIEPMKFKLVNSSDKEFDLFATEALNDKATSFITDLTYYFAVEGENKSEMKFQIQDAQGNIVVSSDDITYIFSGETDTDDGVFKFTFKIANINSYVSGATFTIVKISS